MRELFRRQKLAGSTLALALMLLLAAPGVQASSEVKQFDVEGTSVRIETFSKGRITTLTSPKLRELDIDSEGNGTIDIREIVAGADRIQYSLPSHSGYRRLKIEHRTRDALITEEFTLARDGHRYVLADRRSRKFEVLGDDCSDTSLAASFPLGSGQALPADLLQAIRNSGMLDHSCSRPPFQKDYPSILNAISQVAGSSNDPSHRYLSCLVDHNQGYYAGRVEDDFEQMLKSPEPVIYCASKKYGLLGSYDEETGKISLNKTKAQVRNLDYSAITFHESLHKAGIKDEQVVLAIVACCSQPPGTANSACKDMDQQLAVKASNTAHMLAFSKDLDGFPSLLKTIENNSDAETMDAMFNDYMNNLQKLNQSGAHVYLNCMKSGGDDATCSQKSLSQAIVNVDTYLKQSCPLYFRTKKNSAAICSKIQLQTENILKVNAAKECSSDPGKTAFENSCLVYANKDANQIYAQIQSEKPNQADGIAPILYVDVSKAALADRKRILDAYLTGLNQNMKGVMKFWSQLKESAEPLRAEAMIETWFKKLTGPDQQGLVPAFFKRCEGEEKHDPTQCATQLKASIDGSVTRFFGEVCPAYFTQEENAKNPCQTYQKSFAQLVDDNIAGGCKPSRKDDPTLKANGLDFNCINRGLAQAKNYYDHDGGVDTLKELWADPAYEDKRQAAIKTTNQRANREDLNDVAGATIFDFDPNHMDSLGQAVAQRMDTAKSVVNQISNSIENTADASQAVPGSYSIPSNPGSSGQTQVANTITPKAAPEVQGPEAQVPQTQAIEPVKALPTQATTVSKTPELPATTPILPANPATPAQPPTTDAPASRTSVAPVAAQPVNASAGAKGQAPLQGSVPDSPQRKPAAEEPRSVAQNSAEPFSEPERQLVSYLSSHSQEALVQIHNGSLNPMLIHYHIQVKDTDGMVFGSEDPHIFCTARETIQCSR